MRSSWLTILCVALLASLSSFPSAHGQDGAGPLPVGSNVEANPGEVSATRDSKSKVDASAGDAVALNTNAGSAADTINNPPNHELLSAARRARLEKLLLGSAPKDIDDLRLIQEQVQAVRAKILTATVQVRVGQAHGSGVLIHQDGTVLTAAHVATRPEVDVVAVLSDGTRVRGSSLGMNRNQDAGLMRLSLDTAARSPQPAELSQAEPQVGQWCIAVGHPGGGNEERGVVMRLGRILGIEENGDLRTDCVLIGGDSGGPLFDLEGKVIGIHSRIGPYVTTNLHVPASEFRHSWERMVSKEAWGVLNYRAIKKQFGVRTARDTNDIAEIEAVTDDSAAKECGIQPGDIITRFNNEEVKSFESLKQLVAMATFDEPIGVEVLRDGKRVELEFRFRLSRHRR